MEGKLKSLVYQFLTEVDPKVAKIFQKNQKPKGLPSGSAGLKEIVAYYDKNAAASSPQKGSPQKKAKVDEEHNIIKSPVKSKAPEPKVNGKPATEDDDDTSSDEDDVVENKVNGNAAQDDDDDSSDEADNKVEAKKY